LARFLFERLLGAIYVVAFLVAVNQFPALLGERGLLPTPAYVARHRFWEAPSLFHLGYSDRRLRVVAWTGTVVAASLVVGLPQAGPTLVPMAAWFVLWALYLSIMNVGQRFYSFGWESLLLETGFLAIFLGPADQAPPILVVFLVRWLLFRVEFGAGLIKIRGDRCWRELTCLKYHHETQPMPGPFSWHFHHLPSGLHRVEVAANHVAQLVVPWLLFTPQPVAGGAGLVIVITQLWLVLSGNFSWLNFTTIALAVMAFDNAWLHTVLPVDAPTLHAAPPWFAVLVIGLTVAVAVMSYWPVQNLLSRRQAMNASFNQLHLVNTYGAFGSITRQRHEIVIEGTADEGPDAVWLEYEFKGKPGEVGRRPRQFAPYHLRLDWLMWFAALSPAYAERWFPALIGKLLDGDPSTLRLLRTNPFPDHPPAWIRARFYQYRYSTRAERRETGAWWVRDLVGDYMRPVAGAATVGVDADRHGQLGVPAVGGGRVGRARRRPVPSPGPGRARSRRPDAAPP
jgi:hypothetical protein